MKDLVVYIAKQLVNNPDAVNVDETRDGSYINLLLTVDPDDMGIIIGKSGQTIKAIRRVISIRAMTDNVRVNLQINEPENRVSNEESAPQETKEETSTDETPDQTPSEQSH